MFRFVQFIARVKLQHNLSLFVFNFLRLPVSLSRTCTSPPQPSHTFHYQDSEGEWRISNSNSNVLSTNIKQTSMKITYFSFSFNVYLITSMVILSRHCYKQNVNLRNTITDVTASILMPFLCFPNFALYNSILM